MQKMEGSNLLAAADFLHVSPKWLATGDWRGHEIRQHDASD